MTTTNGTALVPRTIPARVGQGTAVEQSRAVAEVEAAVIVAQRMPRDFSRADADMRRSCAQEALAQKAFFRYSRGGSQITGPSVQLARELARCFGNLQYGLVELRRDDEFGQSEMLAFAWDVQTNTRSSTTFIVPHKRDKTGGPVQLTDMRDIYENNANNGARRLREMIFAILPGWYTEAAVAACYETLNGDSRDLPDRVAKCVDGFGGRGIPQKQLEAKLGAPRSAWTPGDLATLQVIWRSLMRGEITRDEEFPDASASVTAADIMAAPQTPAAQDGPPASDEATPDPAPQATTQAGKPLLDKLLDAFARLNVQPEDEAAVIAWLAGPGWAATRKQVSDLTRQLSDFVSAESTQGDIEEARSQFWLAFHAAKDRANADAHVRSDGDIDGIPLDIGVDYDTVTICDRRLNRQQLDGDRANPALTNLLYGTHAENMQDMVRHGSGRRPGCINGHPFDEANTYTEPDGHRHCRKCSNAASLRRYYRRKQDAAA